MSRKLVIPKKATDTYTNPYLVFFDIDTGDMAHGTNGISAADTTWGNAAIAGALHSATGGNTNTFVYVFEIPDLDNSLRWAFAMFDNDTPADSDTVVAGAWLYDPVTGRAFTDTNPLIGNQIRTNDRNVR